MTAREWAAAELYRARQLVQGIRSQAAIPRPLDRKAVREGLQLVLEAIDKAAALLIHVGTPAAVER